MRQIFKKFRRTHGLLVVAILSFVIAIPLLSQPLGLSFALSYPRIDDDDPSDFNTEIPVDAIELPPIEDLEIVDEVLNRSSSYNQAEDTETEPARTAEPTEPTGPWDPAELIPSEAADPGYIRVDYILYISANHLNLRAAPSTDSAVLDELEFCDQVRCIAELGEWVLVENDEITGYIKTEYTSKSMVFKTVKETVYVHSSKLNLREEPSTDSAIIVVLSHMQKLTRVGISDGWSKVRTSTGKTGYVASEYLTTRAPVPTSSGKVGTADGPTYPGDAGRIVELSFSALGVRYVHSSSSMDGFDCSGFTSWCYRQIGITIPRSTSGYYNIGQDVSYSDIQPGDILCMDTKTYDGKTSITHVGIYVGDGNMIHASSTNHKVVLRNVDNYLRYGVKLITVRRILE
jgi:cell wall-associated NlpC family hydrolase